MTVEEVITVPVPVADQGQALAFYTGKLGLKLARLDENPAGIRHVEVTGNGITRLSLVTWIESMAPGSLCGLVFRSGNLQADYQRLVSAGIDFDSPPCAGPDGTYQAVFHDPDGNAIVLQGTEAPTSHDFSLSKGRPPGRGIRWRWRRFREPGWVMGGGAHGARR